jgi:hypothetical protein
MKAAVLVLAAWVGFAREAEPIRITGFSVFFDGQAKGYPSSAGAVARWEGKLLYVFQKASDAAAGLRPNYVESRNDGRSWTEPRPWVPEIFTGDPREFVGLSPFGPTRKGTLLAVGFRTRRAVREGNYKEDVRWRPGELLIGRMGRGATQFSWQSHESGVFLGEQFAAPGLILADGRIVVTVWGAARQGENWQAGVLLSDDDGLTWRYRVVGAPVDNSFRDDPEMPVGFNEQTLFELPGGRLISLLRARAKLGRLADSPRDTWYFRSESGDGGETWSKPEPTNLAGTGAPPAGVTLPDGSLLTASRIPYSRSLYPLSNPRAFGLHLARSFDQGKTWRTEHILEKGPDGRLFDNHYNAMNGQFLRVAATEWRYIFGEFRHQENVHRTLEVRFSFSQSRSKKRSVAERR